MKSVDQDPSYSALNFPLAEKKAVLASTVVLAKQAGLIDNSN